VDREELVERGYILDVEVRIVETGFSCGWWEELPEQERPTRWGDLVQEMGHDAERNALVAQLAAQGAREGAQTLVWAHHVEHCLQLRAEVARREPRVGLFVGEMKREFTQTLTGILDGSVRVGVGTFKAISTGIDLPSVGCGVVATPIHTNRQTLTQVKGRLCRAPDGKTEAVLYVLWDRACFGLAPLRNWVKWSKTSRVVAEGQLVDGKAYLKQVVEEERAAREEDGDA
jgi:superfamily II DNA or RNA helicase